MTNSDKANINDYLFFELGFDINPNYNENLISESYPLTLEDTTNPSIFTFLYNDIPYYAITNAGLVIMPKHDLTIEDLQWIRLGARWIGKYHAISLNSSKIGDERVPSFSERYTSIQRLGETFLRVNTFQILEGLFLVKTQTYLALIQLPDSDEAVALGTNLPARIIKHPHSSSHRRLSLAIGQAISEGIIV